MLKNTAQIIGCSLICSAFAMAQTQPTGPDVKIGDTWIYKTKDGFTSDPINEFKNRVVDLSDKEITIQLSFPNSTKRDLKFFTKSWNILDTNGTTYEPYYPEYKFPMTVGDAWSQEYRVSTRDGKSFKAFQKVKVTTFEKVKVPAGEFEAYRLDILNESISMDSNANKTNTRIATWYAPAVNKYIRREVIESADGRIRSKEITELVQYKREEIPTISK